MDLSTFEKQGEGRSDPLEKCAPSADREITPRGSDLTISSMAGRVFVQFQNRGKREVPDIGYSVCLS